MAAPMIAPRIGRVRPPARSAGRLRGLWTVVLAAGGARRFGRSKLLLVTGRDTLLGLAADNASGVTGRRCIVVLGAGAGRARRHLEGRRLSVVVNRRWREGMSASLQAGIDALPRSARAAMVVLADQYAIGPADLRRLAAAWARRPWQAAAATVGGRPGAPAILPRQLFARVQQLRGDQGARQLLREPGFAFTPVPMPEATPDVDERRDLQGLRRRRGRR